MIKRPKIIRRIADKSGRKVEVKVVDLQPLKTFFSIFATSKTK